MGTTVPQSSRTPPARRPVAATLLFKRPIAEEGDETLAFERHVHVFELGETEIAAFRNSTRRVCTDVAANGHRGPAFGSDCIGIEIRWPSA